MTYDEARDAEQLRILGTAIGDFINRYKNARQSSSACRRQTVFFFPGGMASRLRRARQPYQEGVGVPANMSYDDLWIAWDTFIGGWRKLKLHKDGMGCFRDEDDRIVVADDAVALEGASPHDLFIYWCNQNNADWFVFGWDWRRRLDDTVAFFLSKFLPHFRAQVMAAGCPDPLADYSLVGHSFGGMIVNLILRSDAPITATLARGVTVATPSYGYAGQLHRWFEGEPLLLFAEVEALETLGLNFLAQAARMDMLEVISSLPALYTLHFLDEVTYASHQPVLGADPNFALLEYPSVDKPTNGALRADAYNPQVNGGLVRFPTNTGFDLGELDYACAQFQRLAAPMTAQQLKKFYNIRGVGTEIDGQTLVTNTVGSVTWDWISPTFDPSGPSPIVDGPEVPGDDTQPAWSARLASNASARVVSAKGWLMEHACMMNHPTVVDELGAILCAAPPPPQPPPPPRLETASVSDLRKFLRWLYEHRDEVRKWPPLSSKKVRSFVPEEFRDQLPALGRRLFRDLVRGPVKPPRKGEPEPGLGKGKPGGGSKPPKRAKKTK